MPRPKEKVVKVVMGTVAVGKASMPRIYANQQGDSTEREYSSDTLMAAFNEGNKVITNKFEE